MKTDLSLIINSITSPVLVGVPVRAEDNSITDFKVAFTNSQFKQKAGDIIKEDGLWSEVDEHFSKEFSFFRMAVQVTKGFTFKDVSYYSETNKAWYKIDMVYQDSEDIIVVSLTDITSERKYSKQLESSLTTDSLTGLPNKSMLAGHIDEVLAKYPDKPFALLVLDIDNLKNINDSLGDKEGDALIVRTANILLRFQNDDTSIFRYGGDEFVAVMSNLEDEDEAAIIIDDLFNAFQVEKVRISGGVSVFPYHTKNKEELIRFADMALCYAKKNGKNNFVYFEDYMQKVFLRHLTLETKMTSAVFDSAFYQVYQPQFDIHTGKLRGFEALIRWKDPELGNIPPSIFIPLAEESGLIIPIGRWILNTALATIKSWQDKYNFNGIMSINVSPIQLNQDTFIFELTALIDQYGVNPNLLEIEITEGVMINNMNETIDKLQALKDMGIRVSLDDFGTGYSSLNYLQMLPLNTLKIDKSFINNITSDDGVQANITSSIINMVKNMGLETIAEGVEHPEQLDLLNKFNCNIVQGFLQGKPMPLSNCEEYLAGNEKALITIYSN